MSPLAFRDKTSENSMRRIIDSHAVRTHRSTLMLDTLEKPKTLIALPAQHDPRKQRTSAPDRGAKNHIHTHEIFTPMILLMMTHAHTLSASATATLPAPTGVANPERKSGESMVSTKIIATGMPATKRADMRT